jgi:hypothetical protein
MWIIARARSETRGSERLSRAPARLAVTRSRRSIHAISILASSATGKTARRRVAGVDEAATVKGADVDDVAAVEAEGAAAAIVGRIAGDPTAVGLIAVESAIDDRIREARATAAAREVAVTADAATGAGAKEADTAVAGRSSTWIMTTPRLGWEATITRTTTTISTMFRPAAAERTTGGDSTIGSRTT